MLKKKLRYYPIVISFILTSFCSTELHAEDPIRTPYFRSWFTYLSQVSLSEEWSASFELHERTNKFLQEHGQFLFRPSADYHLSKQAIISVGYTFINTEPLNGNISFNEHNLWEQLLLKNSVKQFQFQHRFRLEQRWIEQLIGSNIYNDRFRYRFNLKVQLSKLGDTPLFFQAFDEVWFSLGDGMNSFDFSRNWVYSGIGLDFSKLSNVHIGYMHQLDKNGSSKVITDILQLTFQQNFSLKK